MQRTYDLVYVAVETSREEKILLHDSLFKLSDNNLDYFESWSPLPTESIDSVLWICDRAQIEREEVRHCLDKSR
jgi:hypothetical protein